MKERVSNNNFDWRSIKWSSALRYWGISRASAGLAKMINRWLCSNKQQRSLRCICKLWYHRRGQGSSDSSGPTFRYCGSLTTILIDVRSSDLPHCDTGVFQGRLLGWQRWSTGDYVRTNSKGRCVASANFGIIAEAKDQVIPRAPLFVTVAICGYTSS